MELAYALQVNTLTVLLYTATGVTIPATSAVYCQQTVQHAMTGQEFWSITPVLALQGTGMMKTIGATHVT